MSTQIVIKYPKGIYGHYHNRWGTETSIGIKMEIEYDGNIKLIPLTPKGMDSVCFISIPRDMIKEFKENL